MSITQLGLTGTPSKQYSVSPKRAATTVTKSIGTSSRDYSTMTAWEADLDNTLVYVSGDDAVGECYNDSTFSVTSTVTIDGGATVGLNSITLTVADAEKHDGTAGTGAKIDNSTALASGSIYMSTNIYITVSWLELEYSGPSGGNGGRSGIGSTVPSTNRTVSHMIVHELIGRRTVTALGAANCINNIVYNIETTNLSSDSSNAINMAGSNWYIDYTIANNTVYNIIKPPTSSYPLNAFGIRYSTRTATNSGFVKNNIAVGAETDYSRFDNSGDLSEVTNNISSDATAVGTDDITGVVIADQFVSIVSGSEDLHLKSGSDAIGAGVDLGTTPDGVQYDIDGVDRDARGTTWDIGADQAAGPVTKTIGTTARDYSTITLWEADLDLSTVYQSGDDAVGECYNDSTFDESVTINNAPDSVGLGDVTLTVADGERHDGTEGTGARIVRTSGGSASITPTLRPQLGTITIEWLEIDHNGNNDDSQGAVRLSGSGGTTSTYRVVKNLIVHGVNGYGRCRGINSAISGGTGYIFNCFVYDISATFDDTIYSGAGINSNNYTETYNCSVLNTDRGVVLTGSNVITNNVISCDASDDDDFVLSGTYSHLLSSDTSATGTGSLISKASSDQFVSTVSGSEDLHLKSGSDAIGAGTDLGTSPAGVQYDIDGVDRDARGTTWDMGADQAAGTVTKTIGTTARDYSTMTLWEADLDDSTVYQSGDDAVGECYNDSTFDEQFNIDGGVTVGLTSTNLTVASGERHDGTAGTGALLFKTSGGSPYYNITINLNGVNRTLEWLEYQRTGTTFGAIATISTTASTEGYIRNNICHNIDSATTSEPAVISLANATTLLLSVTNNIVYACNHTANNATQMNGIRSFGVGPGSTIANNTVHAIGKTQGTGDCHGIGNVTDDSDLSFKNNLSTDTTNSGTGAAKDYETTSLTNTDSATNMSSDATSPETGLRNVVTSDQFVSIVSGSEDLHLKAGSDAIGAGTDLGTTPNGVQYDIDGVDRDARGTTWDIGADQAAGTVTKTIGTTARDYSTMTLWEADLDDSTVYQSGDDAVGECYNDSVFDESVTIDGGGTVGLNSGTITVAAGERHDGTAGTGARLIATASRTLYLWSPGRSLKWLELDGNSTNLVRVVCLGGTNNYTASNLIVHSAKRATGIGGNQRPGNIHNNIIYDIYESLVNPGSDFGCGGISFTLSSGVTGGFVYNNTVYNIVKDNGDGTSVGIQVGGGDRDAPCRNNIAVDVGGTSSGTVQCFNLSTTGTISNNLSSDTSATGTGSITNAVTADQFVSIVSGSEDLHLKAGADAIGAGVDLGTTPTGVEIDIDGRDRDAEGDTWSIGADQFVEILYRHFFTRLGLRATPQAYWFWEGSRTASEEEEGSKGKNFFIFFY
jgi:hypothetical protein